MRKGICSLQPPSFLAAGVGLWAAATTGSMFEAGNYIIESMASAAEAVFTSEPTRVRLLEAAASGTKESAVKAKRTSRASTNLAAARLVRRMKHGARVGARRTPIPVEARGTNS
jgi:hypothetical protein